MSEEIKIESMEDFTAELEASLKKVKEGDSLTGTVIDIDENYVILDINYCREGIIYKTELSRDPDFSIDKEIEMGTTVTAVVIREDDREGHVLLSAIEASDKEGWSKLNRMLEERAVITAKISQIVKGGAIVYLEGIRGFIPVSKLDAGYVENLEEWKDRTVEVMVITADQQENSLILSAKEPARERLKEQRGNQISKCELGALMEGTVDKIMPYGAFVVLENGLSGLLHISQICEKRIKHPGVILTEGQNIKVKIISLQDQKISLSMKDAMDMDETDHGSFEEYQGDGAIATGLGDLLKGLKF